MKLKKYRIYIKGACNSSVNSMRYIKFLSFPLLILCITSCTDFIEADPPKNTLVTETVFEDVKTAQAALANIYYKMREQGMLSGFFGLSISMGAYTDELDYYGYNANQLKLYNHNVTSSDATVYGWWSHAYNLIYAANDIIKGVENSTDIALEEQEQLRGEALFVRAYLHSLLAALHGDIPYIETTSYIENSTVARTPINEVYEKIIADLILAESLLDDMDTNEERVLPNKSVVNALLARMYLYADNWALAEATADKLITTHNLEPDINKVFLKDSHETLWQFKPGGPSIENTQEGQSLIITSVPTQGYALTNNLLMAFESGDLRRSNWVGSITSTDGLTTLHFANKYKETVNSTTLSLEYSIIFRLSEQYLIRAEARAQQGKLAGARQDIDSIRYRAALPLYADSTTLDKNDLIEVIMHERRIELFTEHGQRWFDLKRTSKASEVLIPLKVNWQNTHTLLPIPDTELLANPNLEPQNDGY